MSGSEKIAMTWLLFIIPIFLYGLMEISQGKKNRRWWMLGIWFTGIFVGVMCFIWI